VPNRICPEHRSADRTLSCLFPWAFGQAGRMEFSQSVSA